MLEGKVAVVCGAGPDIGRTNALALARSGADIAVNVHRNRDVIEQTADEIRRMGRRSIAVLADIGDPQQVGEMFRQIQRETIGHCRHLDKQRHPAFRFAIFRSPHKLGNCVADESHWTYAL